VPAGIRAKEKEMEKTLLRVGEAAEFLSVSRWTIYRWLEQGRLEGTKISKGSTRVFRASLEHLVHENRIDEARIHDGSHVGKSCLRH
jgi:excisionase family DNA binding protein